MSRFLLCALAALALTSCDSPTAPDWTLDWADDFNGAAGSLPSSANWRFDVGTDWGNAQLEYDTDRAENASLDGQGHLLITARSESYKGRVYTSARITTKGLHEHTRGKFEARMKMPTGRGMWPAFWLLGANFATVGWPATGEIDVMEYRGQEPAIVHGSLHGPGYSGGNAFTRSYTLPAGRFDQDFHVFSVEWTSSRIDWYVDGVIYQSIKPTYVPGTWVFDHPFYLILNLAVGGNYVGNPDGGTIFPQSLVVDWVKVYR